MNQEWLEDYNSWLAVAVFDHQIQKNIDYKSEKMHVSAVTVSYSAQPSSQ